MIYLDNNATTKVAPEVLEAMLPFLGGSFGNPSSAHDTGKTAKRAIDDARAMVAGMLGATPDEIYFTSGGTESDNWAVMSAVGKAAGREHIITTAVEHEAVRNACKSLENEGNRVSYLGVNNDGAIDLEELRSLLSERTALVSIMLANNETGIMFPVDEAAAIVKENSNALFHTDGVNAAGKVAIDMSRSSVDMLSISAHKFHGPKGVGALFVRKGLDIGPSLIGGGQEHGRRAGTEAVHQIAGLGKAAEIATDLSPMVDVRKLRDRLEDALLERFAFAQLNGTTDREKRLPNTSSISFENLNGEMILNLLNADGIAVSTGSACNSADHTPSAVMTAMDIPFSRAMGSIRFSLGRYNTADEIETAIEATVRAVEKAAEIAGRT